MYVCMYMYVFYTMYSLTSKSVINFVAPSLIRFLDSFRW